MKVSSKTIKKSSNVSSNPEDFSKIFNQMTGVQEPDPEIIIPKYECIIKNIKNIRNIFEKYFFKNLYITETLKNDNLHGFDSLQRFINQCDKDLKYFYVENSSHLDSKKIAELNNNPELLQKYIICFQHGYDLGKLHPAYRDIKECDSINNILTGSRDLYKLILEYKKLKKKNKHDLEIWGELTDNFIIHGDDFMEIIPTITSLDFKEFWGHEDINNDVKKRIITCLHLFLKYSEEIINQIMSPDIDMDEFVKIIIDSIAGLKKHVPRCDKAFNKIEQSVHLLKDNFGSYYKYYVSSKNETSIIENFISDVANENTNGDPQLIKQFKDIIKFYKKQISNHNIKNDEIDNIFEALNFNINKLEEKTGRDYGNKEIV